MSYFGRTNQLLCCARFRSSCFSANLGNVATIILTAYSKTKEAYLKRKQQEEKAANSSDPRL